MLKALSFLFFFFGGGGGGSKLKFLVEWMTGQSLQLFPLDGSFVLASAFQRVEVLRSFPFVGLVCFS